MFGIVNAIVKPIVAFLSIPLYILTLGLFTIIVNALMLMLTAWITEATDWGLRIDNFGVAVLGRHHHLDRQPGPLASSSPAAPRASAHVVVDRDHLLGRRPSAVCAATTAGSRVTWNCRVTAVVPGGPSTVPARRRRTPACPGSPRAPRSASAAVST